MAKMKAKPKKRKRTSICQLLANIRKATTRKKSHGKKGSEQFSIARIFGVTILPTEKQYENIAITLLDVIRFLVSKTVVLNE